jgi:hypothetical protein
MESTTHLAPRIIGRLLLTPLGTEPGVLPDLHPDRTTTAPTLVAGQHYFSPFLTFCLSESFLRWGTQEFM